MRGLPRAVGPDRSSVVGYARSQESETEIHPVAQRTDRHEQPCDDEPQKMCKGRVRACFGSGFLGFDSDGHVVLLLDCHRCGGLPQRFNSAPIFFDCSG